MSLPERIIRRLDERADRHSEIEALLGDPEIVSDHNRYRSLSREHATLQPIMDAYSRFKSIDEELQDTLDLADLDDELRILAKQEAQELQQVLEQASQEIEQLLLPKDPDDHANVFLEVRAGTGGDEAALFARVLVKMYQKYADARGWNAKLMSIRPTPQGGCKEAILRITGNEVYSRLKFESGAHRVQRVPVTESQGRVHTSACTVAILPELEEIVDVEVNDSDLRIDTYRASGAGGQHVNKTDSAVRITHLPSGTVVECQEERSQHQNKERAMGLLRSKLLDVKKQAQDQQRVTERKLQVGSGDRSERIRTYNYSQGRITDHRVNLTLYKLDEVLEGSLDQVIDLLIQAHQADLLKELQAEDTSSIDARA